MSQELARLEVEHSCDGGVFVILDKAWIKVENRGGNLTVLANHTHAGLDDDREVFAIDGEDGTINARGEA